MKKLILLVFVSCILFLVPSAYANTVSSASSLGEAGGNIGAGVYDPTPNSNKPELYEDPGYNDTKFADRIVGNIINGGGRKIFGYEVSGEASGSVGKTSLKNGAIQAIASGMDAIITTRPASSIDYIAYEMKNLKIPGSATPAYAAGGGGLGFDKLSPVLSIWTVTRNLAYMIFAILFIVIGIMIMTRQKIDPKTVANIQNALPKIIMALLLVTFSYAIAGFLIDLMYVSLGLLVTLHKAITAGSTQANVTKDLTSMLGGSIFQFATDGGLLNVSGSIGQAAGQIVDNIFKGTNIVGEAAGHGLGWIASGLAFLIVGIAILVALFRTWLALIGAYVNILLSIVFAPLQLMMDVIPGQNQFKNWLKNMLANLLAFPLVTIMLFVGQIIATNFGNAYGGNPEQGFVPPLVGIGNQVVAQGLIGLGILLTIPKALDILKEVLKAPVFKYGNAWGESLNAGGKGAVITGRVADKLADKVEVGGTKPWTRAKTYVRSWLP